MGERLVEAIVAVQTDNLRFQYFQAYYSGIAKQTSWVKQLPNHVLSVEHAQKYLKSRKKTNDVEFFRKFTLLNRKQQIRLREYPTR